MFKSGLRRGGRGMWRVIRSTRRKPWSGSCEVRGTANITTRPRLALRLNTEASRPDEFADMYYCSTSDKYMSMNQREAHLVDQFYLAQVAAQETCS